MSKYHEEVPPHLSVGFADASAYSGMLLGAWLRARKEHSRLENTQADMGLGLLDVSFQDEYPPISLPLEFVSNQSHIKGVPVQEDFTDTSENFEMLLVRMHQEYKLRHSL